MSQSRLNLLCTFVADVFLDPSAQIFQEIYDVYRPDNVFIYKIKNSNTIEHIITYNPLQQTQQRLKQTILIHRKKETNTLFSINALNEYIRAKNSGLLDPSIVINWKELTNCLLSSNKFYTFYITPLNFVGKISLS